MTKKEIVRAIAEETDFTQAIVKEVVQRTFDHILESLARGQRVELRNFGVFDLKSRAARKARNPTTGEQVDIPARVVVSFKPSQQMAQRVAASDQEQRFGLSGFMPDGVPAEESSSDEAPRATPSPDNSAT